MKLKNKVAIITGSTKGIGAAMATAFAAQQARVVVSGRNSSAGQHVVEGIQAAGGHAVFVQADVSLEKDVQALVRGAVGHFGRIDVLVNNAYPVDSATSGAEAPVDQMTTEHWDYFIRAGLYGPFWCCKYAIPEMRKAGGGSIINISTVGSKVGLNGTPAYCAVKGALNSLTRQLAVDFGKDGIRSNVILPGFVLSGPAAQHAFDSPEGAGLRAMSLTRMGQCADISNAAIYLASDEAEFITGVELPVDGGVLARGYQMNARAGWDPS